MKGERGRRNEENTGMEMDRDNEKEGRDERKECDGGKNNRAQVKRWM